MRTLWLVLLLLIIVMSGCKKPPLASLPSPLKVETRRFERVVPGCGDKAKREQACFSFQAVYPEVTAAQTVEVMVRLNARILALLQPVGAPAGFEEESAQLVEKYGSRELPGGADAEEPAWFVRRTAEVVHSTAAALAVRVERTEYLGGANSSTVFECVNLNPATGEVLTLGDLVAAGSEERLRVAAEARFRAEHRIPAEQKLSEAGYIFPEDRLELPRCYLAGAKGLEFIFNPHEIAPDSKGPTHLVLPWPAITGLIRRESGVVPVP